jgi:DNA-binding response OmpR family regulator
VAFHHVTPGERRRHQYGGILILESDPVLRSLLAHELEKTGRNILTAADGAAARSLFMATPDRFELLILEGHARREGGHKLATEALALNGHLRVVMVSSDPGAVPELPAECRNRCSLIRKPFGIMEIREAGARLLDL